MSLALPSIITPLQLAADYLEAHEDEYAHFIDDSLGSFKE
jgi:hypothetical protein